MHRHVSIVTDRFQSAKHQWIIDAPFVLQTDRIVRDFTLNPRQKTCLSLWSADVILKIDVQKIRREPFECLNTVILSAQVEVGRFIDDPEIFFYPPALIHRPNPLPFQTDFAYEIDAPDGYPVQRLHRRRVVPRECLPRPSSQCG